MIDPSQVEDGKTLERYLDELPEEKRREVAVRVASNAALRVLPIAARDFAAADWARERDLTPVAVFGASSISAVAGVAPTAKISLASAAATYATDAATYAATYATYATYATIDEVTAAATASAAADAATYATDAASATAAATAYATATVAATANTKIDLWSYVLGDLLGPEASVWPGGMPDDMQRIWDDAKTALCALDPSWEVWILWYERVIAGRDWHPDAMWEVLKTFTREEDWQGDPIAINRKFDEVLKLYQDEDINALIAATPIAETISFDPKNETLSLQPNDQIAPDYLLNVIGQLESAIRLFDGPEGVTNAYKPLEREIKILRDAVDLNNERPVLLLKAVTRVQNRLARKIEAQDCPSPEQDENIEDFQGILSDVQLELVALSPEVREYHEATRPPLLPDSAEQIAEAAKTVGLSADNALATALTEAAFLLLDPSADDTVRRQMQYWLVAVVARSYRAVKPYYTAGRSALAETAKLTKDLGAVAVGIRYLLSAEFRQWISNLIKDWLP